MTSPRLLWLSLTALLFVVRTEAAPANARNMTCATCHRAEAQSQPKTGMATAVQLPPDQKLLEQHPKLTFEKHGYSYLVERKNGASTYTVSDASGSLTLPIQYALGENNLTFVLEYQGHFYESLVSYYENSGGLAITIGDERIEPHNLTEAMGRLNSNQDIAACFGCHSSHAVVNGQLTLASMKPGVDCEHCHDGAGAHLESMAAGKPGPVPPKLGDMAAEDMSNFCGQCHRTWEEVLMQRIFGEKNVRFQPYRLANSQCFLGDDKRIRCTACHDPHVELVPDAASYDRACLACHTQKTGATVAGATQKPCPVADSNCVNCHMPKVQLPSNPTVFTDHNIRVVRAGQPYPD